MQDSALDNLLRSTGNEMPLPQGFRRKVWLRIENASADRLGFVARLERTFFHLTKPYAATAAVLAMVTLGLGLGASARNPEVDLKSAYVESVSPFAGQHGE